MALLSIALPATAQSMPTESSGLDPYSLHAELLVENGPDRVGTIRSLPCPEIYEVIEAYNTLDPELEAGSQVTEEWISFHELSERDRIDLLTYARSEFPEYDHIDLGTIISCTTVWEDAWVAADSDVVELAGEDGGGRMIEVTVEGPLACDYGELLLVSATRWWWEGRWQYGTGRNWTETGSGTFEATGDLTFACERIVDPGEDLAHVADAVPSTRSLHNPLVMGLTGLETWYWYDFSTPDSSEIAVTTSIEAFGHTYPITATAWVDQVWWDPDCESDCTWRGMLAEWPGHGFEHGLVLDLDDQPLSPAPVYDGGAGTEEDHAAAFLYDRKGDYTLSTATIWRGFYTYQGVNHPYDPVMVADSVPFQVCEMVTVLSTPGEALDLNSCTP